MTTDQINTIIDFLESTNDLELIREKLISYHPADLAILLNNLSKEERKIVYEALSIDELSVLFSYLEEDQAHYLSELDQQKVSSVLENMEIDDAVSILRDVDDERLKEDYIKLLSEETRDELEFISEIDEDSVGSIMTTNYISVNSNIDVKEAMKTLINEADESEIIEEIYVVENDLLIGIIDLKDLIIARSPKNINEIMKTNPITIDKNEKTTNAFLKIRNYGLSILPVVDNGKLVGIVTGDDAMDSYTTESDIKYGSLAGVSTEDLREKNIFKNYIERIPWLLFLLALGIIISNVISVFEGIINQVTILVFFQSLILDMSGNVGTQSLAVTIQNLTREDSLSNKEIKKHLLKEFKASLINSLILTILSIGICYTFITIYGSYEHSPLLISLVISIALGLSLIISNFIGAILPIFFTKIKIDPAAASGPLITTLNDIFAVVIYFTLAALLLGLII